MSDELISLVLSSISAYLELLDRFATPEDELIPNATWAHALPPPEPPMLHVALKLDAEAGAIVYEPPLEEVTPRRRRSSVVIGRRRVVVVAVAALLLRLAPFPPTFGRCVE